MKMTDASGIGPFRITRDGNERDVHEIHELLREYNLAHREASQCVPVGVFLEDETGQKLAGLTGETFGNWLCIQYLFVREQLRGQRIGSRLLKAVYPVHLSPVVRECAQRYLGGHPRIHLIDPLDVEQMHNLIARCCFVMTDSGGLQEEAPALGKPVLVMRRETERPEAIAAGTAKLAGVEREQIVTMASELLENPQAYNAMAKAVNPYGDGHACQRIAQAILWHFGVSDQRPTDFQPNV